MFYTQNFKFLKRIQKRKVWRSLFDDCSKVSRDSDEGLPISTSKNYNAVEPVPSTVCNAQLFLS